MCDARFGPNQQTAMDHINNAVQAFYGALQDLNLENTNKKFVKFKKR